METNKGKYEIELKWTSYFIIFQILFGLVYFVFVLLTVAFLDSDFYEAIIFLSYILLFVLLIYLTNRCKKEILIERQVDEFLLFWRVLFQILIMQFMF